MAEENLEGNDTLFTGGDPKDGDPKDGDPKDGDPKDGDPKDGDPKDGDPKDGDPKDGDPKDGDPKPVEYKDFTAPEGIELNQEVLGTFKDFATEQKLSQEQAQSVVDMGLKLVQDAQTQQADAFTAQRQEWNTATKADPEFGRDNLTDNLIGGKAVLEKYGSKELIDFLEASGIGDHPEVIRLLVNVHKATKEDSLPLGSKATAAGDKGALKYGASDHN